MKLAFYKAFGPSATILDNLIGIFSFGLYSHVEIIFVDGQSFSISPRDKGARFKRINYNPKHWKIIDILVTSDEEEVIRHWCQKLLGKKYDYSGALTSIAPVCIQDSNKLFCSEAVINVFHNAKIPIKTALAVKKKYHKIIGDGCKYSPSRLYKEISV